MTHAEYVRALRSKLPERAFEPSLDRRFLAALVHLLLVIVGWLAFRKVSHVFWPLLSIVVGHSLACLAFFAHDLSHRTVTRNNQLCSFMEFVCWPLNFIPPTMWKKLHNESHHARPNTPRDPDRRFSTREKSTATVTYTAIFFPHKRLKYNVLCLLHFVTYIIRHMVAVFYVGDKKPSINTFKPHYSFRERMRILAEIGFIFALQFAIFFLSGMKWQAYLWASPIALLSASTVVMLYIFTNHFLNPLGDGQDPLAATTSVAVPGIFNKLHFNFSFHTEHHLFPAMNSEFYPIVSHLLSEYYPNEYNRISFRRAWFQLWELDFFVSEPLDQPNLSVERISDRTNS
jgi:fatty acid desaturase